MEATAEITKLLRENHNERNRAGMARYGIDSSTAEGVPTPFLLELCRKYKNNTPLALELWQTNIHEARTMAPMIASPKDFRVEDVQRWTADFRSWDVCDQCCMKLFRYLPYAYELIEPFAQSDEEFTRRTAFSLIATLAVGDKKAPDAVFESFLPLIERYSTDPRNFVRKAVNWALRGIGKRNMALNAAAIEVSEKLIASNDKTARWIGHDALRELSAAKTLDRIKY
ncbi:MAG: DNA alkylation repair protein [Tidjanibacter sp.]|nr:DNA alkylation repair protein [Tidjanibacter sp.]